MLALNILLYGVHEDSAIERYMTETKNRVEKIGRCMFDCDCV